MLCDFDERFWEAKRRSTKCFHGPSWLSTKSVVRMVGSPAWENIVDLVSSAFGPGSLVWRHWPGQKTGGENGENIPPGTKLDMERMLKQLQAIPRLRFPLHVPEIQNQHPRHGAKTSSVISDLFKSGHDFERYLLQGLSSDRFRHFVMDLKPAAKKPLLPKNLKDRGLPCLGSQDRKACQRLVPSPEMWGRWHFSSFHIFPVSSIFTSHPSSSEGWTLQNQSCIILSYCHRWVGITPVWISNQFPHEISWWSVPTTCPILFPGYSHSILLYM